MRFTKQRLITSAILLAVTLAVGACGNARQSAADKLNQFVACTSVLPGAPAAQTFTAAQLAPCSDQDIMNLNQSFDCLFNGNYCQLAKTAAAGDSSSATQLAAISAQCKPFNDAVSAACKAAEGTASP